MVTFVTFNYKKFNKGSSCIKSECIHIDFCIEEMNLPWQFLFGNQHAFSLHVNLAGQTIST